MFTQKLLSIFTPAPKSHSLLKFIDVYDRHSFIRQYIFDNIPVLALTYLFFYWALWYANKVIKKIEETNREMEITVEDNKTKIDDVLALKNKRQEYEEVVIKAKRAQRITAHQLESEIKKLKDDLLETTEKLTSLEKILAKMNFSDYPGQRIPMSKSATTVRRTPKVRRRSSEIRLRTSRYSSRHFRRLQHVGSTVSLSLEPPKTPGQSTGLDSSSGVEESSQQFFKDEQRWGTFRRKL